MHNPEQVEPPDGVAWMRDALERLERPLIAYAARITGDTDLARDVVQEAFLRLCTEDLANRNGHLRPWLYTVCRHRALDVRRKDRRMQTLTDAFVDSRESAERDPAFGCESRESGSRALRLVGRLPRNQQEVVCLRFQHDLSYKEIAGVTGLSVTNVGFLIHTAIKTLRGWMSD